MDIEEELRVLKELKEEKEDFLKWLSGYFDGKGTISLRFRGKYIQPLIQIRGKKSTLELIKKELNLRKKIQFHKYSFSHKTKIEHCAEGDWTIDLVSKKDIKNFIYQIYHRSILKKQQLALIDEALGIRDENYQKDFKIKKLKEIKNKISILNKEKLSTSLP